MAIPHAKPGEIVDVRPLGSALASAQTQTLVRAEQVEVIRLVVPAGKQIDEHNWPSRNNLFRRRRGRRNRSSSLFRRGSMYRDIR